MSENIDRRTALWAIAWLWAMMVSWTASASLVEIMCETSELDWKNIDTNTNNLKEKWCNKFWTDDKNDSWAYKQTIKYFEIELCFPKRDWCVPEIPIAYDA